MKGKTTTLLVLLLLSTIISSCCSTESEAKETSEQFVKFIGRGNYQKAFSLLSKTKKRKTGGYAGFKKVLDQSKIRKAGEFKSFKQRLSYTQKVGFFLVFISHFEKALVHTDIRINKNGKISNFNIKTTKTE